MKLGKRMRWTEGGRLSEGVIDGGKVSKVGRSVVWREGRGVIVSVINSYIVSCFPISNIIYSVGANHDTSTGTTERVHRWKHDMYQQGTRRW